MRQQGMSLLGVRLAALGSLLVLAAVSPGLWSSRYGYVRHAPLSRPALAPPQRQIAVEAPGWFGPYGCDPSKLPRLNVRAEKCIDWSRLPEGLATVPLQWETPQPPIGSPHRPLPDWSWYGQSSRAPQAPVAAITSILVAARPVVPPSPVLDVLPAPEASVGESPELAGGWQRPAELLARLDSLSSSSLYGPWASRTAALVRELSAAAPDQHDVRHETLELLIAAESELNRLLADATNDGTSEARRAGHALARRMQAWRVALALESSGEQEGLQNPQRLARCLEGVLAVTDREPHGQSWREFLMLDALSDVAQRRQCVDETDDRDLSQRILARLDRARNVLADRYSNGPFAALAGELRDWQAEPVSAVQLLADLERYEQSRLPSDGRLVAVSLKRLKSSGAGDLQPLAAGVEDYYRNCNFRVAVTNDMLNRLLSPAEPVSTPVRDTILGVPVRGSSTTTSETRFRLTPDDAKLRMTLEVAGLVRANTTSRSGPVALYSDSSSRYTAVKELELGLKGIRAAPATAEADTRAELRGISTDYDRVPLFGSLVRGYARRQYDESRSAARLEAEQKLERQLRSRIDKQADERLTSLNRRLSEQLLIPLERMALDPSHVYMQTDAKRMTLRARLAQDDQLAAHTPRPMAPSDSLASLQVHESALNNALERFDLAGRRFTIKELTAWVDYKLNRGPAPVAGDPDAPLGETYVRITFAKKDAMRVRCHEGKVELAFAFATLERGSRRWENLELSVSYRPQPAGLGIELVRDGVVSLAGDSLNLQSQFILRTTFNRLFSEKTRWGVLVEETAKDPRLAGLSVTQCVIEDGWLGLAIGPVRHDVARETSGRRF